MENWYELYKSAKSHQREQERFAMNYALIKAARRKNKKSITLFGRRVMNQLGRFLEMWGRGLQKRFQTC